MFYSRRIPDERSLPECGAPSGMGVVREAAVALIKGKNEMSVLMNMEVHPFRRNAGAPEPGLEVAYLDSSGP